MRIRIHAIIIAAAALMASMQAGAVTKEEMEQARTITAQAYLRYANNGSGYLDDLKPKTMGELTAKLKAKEKENLKSFEAVAVPTDYASWDKDKLVEYWSSTFFKSPGLLAEGVKARSRVASRLKALKISEPQAAAAEPAAAPKPEQTPAATAPAATQPAAEAAPATALPTAEQAIAETDPDAAVPEPADSDDGSSSTWIYVVILCILVAVVVWLVVYAVNTMKARPAAPGAPASSPQGAPKSDSKAASKAAPKAKAETRSMFRPLRTEAKPEPAASSYEAESERSVYAPRQEAEPAPRAAEYYSAPAEPAQTQSASAEQLEAELESWKARCTQREHRIRTLETEVERLTSELTAARKAAAAATAAAQAAQAKAAAQAEATPAAAPQPRYTPRPEAKRTTHKIYLGRANQRGIFMSAARDFTPGSSVFLLTTTDGMSGSFTVASNPEAVDMALASPEETLAGACTAHNLDQTSGATEILTQQAGTAVFEGGCWRVARKARIAYA